jgi:hypothetical protein
MNKAILDRGTSIDLDNVPASLKRTGFSRFGKAQHLESMNVRGEEAKKILDQLFPPEERPAISIAPHS